MLSFPTPGRYGAEFTTAVGRRPARDDPPDVRRPAELAGRQGRRPAPASKTPTLADVGGDVTRISTDDDPDPAFYETSVDEALADHEPFVLIFATPKFCKTAQCGPTLDRIKPFVARYPTVTFINVEPYKLTLVDGASSPSSTRTASSRRSRQPTSGTWSTSRSCSSSIARASCRARSS